jgi:hypothetical protein
MSNPTWWQTVLTIIQWEWVYNHLGAPMSTLVFSAIIALVVAVWLYRNGYGSVKRGLIAFGVFVASMALFVMLAVLSELEKNYDYALGYQSLVVALTPDGEFQVGVILVNVGPAAIKYEVRDFRVVIGDTTITEPVFINKWGIIPKMLGRTYRYDYFRPDRVRDYLGKSTKGSVEFTIDYGPYNGRAQRTLKAKLNTTFNLIYPPQVVDTFAEEKETKYIDPEVP